MIYNEFVPTHPSHCAQIEWHFKTINEMPRSIVHLRIFLPRLHYPEQEQRFEEKCNRGQQSARERRRWHWNDWILLIVWCYEDVEKLIYSTKFYVDDASKFCTRVKGLAYVSRKWYAQKKLTFIWHNVRKIATAKTMLTYEPNRCGDIFFVYW